MTRAADIPTDWLYKGKRKTAARSGARRSRSASISNGALSQGGSVPTSPVPPHWDDKPRQPAAAAAAPAAPAETVLVDAPALSGHHQKRTRSSSVASSDLKRNDSLGERSKRSLFGSLFGKKNGPAFKEPQSPEVRPQTPARVPSPERMVLNKSQAKPEVPIQELSSLRLKRVNFAVDKFESDPPQQLPSRKPRTGNVLVPNDMISAVPPISQGISTHKISAANPANVTVTKDSREYKLALDEYRRAAKESLKHQQEAHYAAQRIEHEVANFRNVQTAPQPTKTQAPNPEIDRKIATLSIDKPIHMHEHHFAQEEGSSETEVTLDVVYTRCCHLREILPIPSTLRQVKGKTAPLHTLKFLNPKPTLIDILSFCDFISVVPINTVVFDKVTLPPEMFKTVMTSLVNSQSLDKLSLRNVNIDQQGWKIFCKFLLTNNSLTKLDISQTKVKPDSPEGLHRDEMDWSLFARVLTKREGKNLEELLLNGIKFSKLPLDTFQRVLNAYAQRENLVVPLKLGVATSDINIDCLKFLLTWMSENNVQGVDMAFNDLSAVVKPLVSKLSSLQYERLEYFTLNGAGITNAYDLALILKYLSSMPNLKFLDLSNLPLVFPDAFPYMYKYLPRFPNLNRIHFDSNGLKFTDISMICNILVKCKSLTHVSLMSQGPLVEISDSEDEETQKLKTFARNALSATIYAFVKESSNLVGLDIDYDNISDEIKSRVAIMLMRNVNKNIDDDFHLDDASSQDDLLFDGSLITETAEDILKRLENEEKMKTDATRRYLTKKYFEKLQKVHHRVQSTIDEMFDKRSSGELSLREKENLVRLLLLEKNLANIMEIFSNVPHASQVLSGSSLSLPGLKHVGSEAALSAPSSSDHDNITNPHVMAADSGTIIDCLTGKPLLLRDDSVTSALGKRQEEEEGELHKWGFFIQQQRSLYPDSDTKTLTNSRIPSNPVRSSQNSSSASSTAETKISQPRILPKIPSGTELRDAIIKAKGIDSIEDLIQNVNSEHVELESIYGGSLRSSDSPTIDTKIAKNEVIASTESDDVNTDATVKQSYEKLLNNLKMERPPKKSSINPAIK